MSPNAAQSESHTSTITSVSITESVTQPHQIYNTCSPWMSTSYTVVIVILSLYAGGTSNLQDLRDVEGDTKTGWLTMPICFGMSTSKKLLSIMFTTLLIFLLITTWNHSLQPVTLFKLVYIFADILAHLYIAI